MTIPHEFTPEGVQEAFTEGQPLFRDFLKSKEPFDTLMREHPWLIPPNLKDPLDLEGDHYWNTTTGDRHPDWAGIALPEPTQDLAQMRADFANWGYTLIEAALSDAQCDRFLTRLLEQADAEAAIGVDLQTPTGQYVPCLINKGDCFRGAIEHDPEHVQAGPLIEAFLNETLGYGWVCHSFLGNGAYPGRYPQGLHLDQGPLLPWVTSEAPALVNTMFIPQDVDEQNGGTLIVPGSHKLFIEAGSAGKIQGLRRPINLKARAGTVMVFDGRVLHGTGVNRTSNRRYVATMSNVKSWMRQQENWVLSTRPEIIDQASPKLLHRMGMQSVTWGATVEGFGLAARGRAGDRAGNIQKFRQAQDQGTYHRVGQLRSADIKRYHASDFTLAEVNRWMNTGDEVSPLSRNDRNLKGLKGLKGADPR